MAQGEDSPRYHLNSRIHGHSIAITGEPEPTYYHSVGMLRGDNLNALYALPPTVHSLSKHFFKNSPSRRLHISIKLTYFSRSVNNISHLYTKIKHCLFNYGLMCYTVYEVRCLLCTTVRSSVPDLPVFLQQSI